MQNAELQITFELPDAPTMRQALRYESEQDSRYNESLYERLWAAACKSGLISAWQSEALPDADASALDRDLSGPALDVLKWVSLAVFSYVQQAKADGAPKNS